MKNIILTAIVIFYFTYWMVDLIFHIRLHGLSFIIGYVIIGIVSATYNYLEAARHKKIWAGIGFLVGGYGVFALAVVNVVKRLRNK